MKLKVRILLLFLLVVLGVSYGYCEIITFDVYKNYYKKSFSQKKINIGLLEEKFEKIKDNKCDRVEYDDYFLLKPICFFKNQFPKVGLKEAVDEVLTEIKYFSDFYNTVDEEFDYKPTYPIYSKNDEMSFLSNFEGTFKQKLITTQLEDKKTIIKIDKKILAQNELKNYSFFVSKRSIVGLGNCTLKNYKNSLNQIDKLFLAPGAIFNLNSAISNIAGYCKGSGRTDLAFYGGSCGTAGQLFRVGLITPGITITKRANHSKWRVRYYGEYAYGDDAAIYEMSKQLEIKNDSDFPIYFRVIYKGNFTYLMGVLPSKIQKHVTISKQEIGDLKSKLSKKTFDSITNEVVDIQVFESTYTQKFYGGV